MSMNIIISKLLFLPLSAAEVLTGSDKFPAGSCLASQKRINSTASGTTFNNVSVQEDKN